MDENEEEYQFSEFQEDPLFSDIGLAYDPELAPIPVEVSSPNASMTSTLNTTATSEVMNDEQEGINCKLFILYYNSFFSFLLF